MTRTQGAAVRTSIRRSLCFAKVGGGSAMQKKILRLLFCIALALHYLWHSCSEMPQLLSMALQSLALNFQSLALNFQMQALAFQKQALAFQSHGWEELHHWLAWPPTRRTLS